MNTAIDRAFTDWSKENELAYEDLIVSIEASERNLNLLICVCDNIQFRAEVIDRYTKELESSIPCYSITLEREEPSLRAALSRLVDTESELKDAKNAVITVTGVESLHSIQWNEERSELDKFFGYLQWTREGLREFPYSIVLWVTSTVEVNLRKKAPDFWSWRKGVFRFFAHLSNFVPCDEFLPVLRSFDEVKTDIEIPLISLEDLLELIQQIEITKGGKDPILASLYTSLGKIYEVRILLEESEYFEQEIALTIQYFQKAIDIQRELNLKSPLADSYKNLADFYKSQEQHQEALDYYQQSLKIFREIKDRQREADSYYDLGKSYDSMGQYCKAVNHYKRSIEIFQEIGDRWMEACSYNVLGDAHRSLSQFKEAEKFYQKALKIAKNFLPKEDFLLDIIYQNLENLQILLRAFAE
jgi:tetratricopeptide (TPR) repeat protein